MQKPAFFVCFSDYLLENGFCYGKDVYSQDAIENGYTTDLTMDENECITTEEFLGHFSKDHYSARINGDRQSNQLFPFADVEETRIILTPNIRFGKDEMAVVYNTGSFTNSFSVENIDVNSITATITNNSSSGLSNNGKVIVSGNTISIILNENSGDTEWKYTVTLTGKRTDGEGTYSKAFVVRQWYRVVSLTLLVSNADSNNWNLSGYGDMHLDGNTSAGLDCYLKSAYNDSGNLIDGRMESHEWTFSYNTNVQFNYRINVKSTINGSWEQKATGSNIVEITIKYSDYKNYYGVQLYVSVSE